ncbi:hypothetical protein [Tateyamaria sp. SN6-1]|uniref:hypothetical protein n=1 Tax=Tateyamaria sp. SN6-1 TaxID=3092148 RepID=UPI0039F63D46
MRFAKAAALTAVLTITGTGVAMADGHGPKIYAYKSHANYCPAGLQPVTMDGTICCGVPNQQHTYQQVMSHPVSKKRHVRRVVRAARADCPVGTKGCTFD